MTSGWAARAIIGLAPRHGGIAMGVWAGVGVWLTPETVPYAVMFVVTALAWSVNPPQGGATSEDLDRISIVFVVLTGAIAMTGIGLRVLDRLADDPVRHCWTSALRAALCALDWVGLYPVVALGPSATMLDAGAGAMVTDVAPTAQAVATADMPFQLLGGALAAIALCVLGWRARSVALGYTALCALAVLILVRGARRSRPIRRPWAPPYHRSF